MTPDVLEAAIAEAVGAPVLGLREVAREDLAYDAFLAGRSVARLHGVARTEAGEVRWSVIEKVTDAPDVVAAYLYDNGLREYFAYGSGLLEDLAPGLGAPRAFGRVAAPDGGLVLLLEEIAGPGVRRVTPDDVPLVARHLGRLAGRWLRRAPNDPWLFTGWIERHAQPGAIGPALELLHGLRRREEVQERIGQPIEEVIAMIEAQPTYRAILEALPITLCHHDAVAANTFIRLRDGEPETVLIDWESVGPGAVGADLASLLFSSARRGDLDSGAVLGLVDPALDAYVAGLRDAGSDVDEHVVRRGFDAAIALRWTLVRDVAAAIERDAAVFRGSSPEESPAQALRQLLLLARLLFASASRARAS